MAQQRNDQDQNPQAKRDPNDRADRQSPRDDRKHEESFPGAEGRPDKVQANQPNRQGGGRTPDQGRRDPQPPDSDRQQAREQGGGRSGESNRPSELQERNQGGHNQGGQRR